MNPSDFNTVVCGTCRFFHNTDYGRGDCRRHAPIASTYDPRAGKENPTFPRTNSGNWCGDHEPAITDTLKEQLSEQVRKLTGCTGRRCHICNRDVGMGILTTINDVDACSNCL